MTTRIHLMAAVLFAGLARAQSASAPAPPAPAEARPPQQPAFVSPEVLADRQVAFRIYAPKAETVKLRGSDIPGNSRGTAMNKSENGVWEVKLGPLEPGAYRYNFDVDGVAVIDPRNPAISESNNNVWSLVPVPGSELMDVKDVPHGAVASLTYYSSVLKKFRRMHVYTPPGYESGQRKYPVFYLLHGSGDSDEAWTSIGRAGVILDNLIANVKAQPMVVVMPAGHVSRTTQPRGSRPEPDPFLQEFMTDILPLAESKYRIIADRAHRAIAGLSMGGGHTLNIAIPNLEKFAYVGVYSSGLFGIVPRTGTNPAPAQESPTWEQQHLAELDNAAAKKGLKLLWFATGKDDTLMPTTLATVEMLKKHGFEPVMKETPGAHTWLNWRNYLIEFAPLLFQ